VVAESKNLVAAIFLLPVWPLAPRDLPFLPYSGLYCRISSLMASLSPVTVGQPVWEARFVGAILLPVRKPSLRRVFLDSDHAECGWSSVADHPILFARLSSARRWHLAWVEMSCSVQA